MVDSDKFPVSGKAVGKTSKTVLADSNFNRDKNKKFSIIDTVGFDDPKKNTSKYTIAELVATLKQRVDFINTFIIAVNGTNKRIDKSLLTTLNLFQKMFGEEFWNQAIIVFTYLSMDEKAVTKRKQINKMTDDEWANEYLRELQNEIPACGGKLKHLFLDSIYTKEDEEEGRFIKLELNFEKIDTVLIIKRIKTLFQRH